MIELNWRDALSLVALLVAVPGISRAAQSYNNCTGYIDSLPAVVATPGTWCMRHDLATSINSGDAITVSSNNVTVDCNNFQLSGAGAGAATLTRGISAPNRQDVTVRHCSVRGFFYGLLVYGNGGGFVIEDNRFDTSTYTAMDIEGPRSVIRRNRVINTGGSTQTSSATGIIVLDSANVTDNVVSGVTATGHGFAIGIDTQDNPDGTIAGNHVRGLVSAGSGAGGATLGIYNLGSSSNRVAYRDNDVIGDGSSGSVGLTCNGGNSDGYGRALDNVISGFATGLNGCSNDGGNVIDP